MVIGYSVLLPVLQTIISFNAGVYELQGNTRSFVQESIRGGICYANPDYSKKEIMCGISDFDMIAMYSDVQERIGRQYGYPTGPPNYLDENSDLSYPLPYLHYVVRVKLFSINKYLLFH